MANLAMLLFALNFLVVFQTYFSPLPPINDVTAYAASHKRSHAIDNSKKGNNLEAANSYADYSMQQTKSLLTNKSVGLSPEVIDKALTALNCAKRNDNNLKNVLTIIDFSLPSNQKRLWVFDLNQNKLLFKTYVSHGVGSGKLLSQYFSNKVNSKSSSLGIFDTDQPYYGRDGISLRLSGLERGFNDNALSRYIVVHGGWYVEENFIQKYGRPGRSWGCPVVPLNLIKPIVETIKNKSLLIAYYPGEDWLKKSRFLHCSNNSQTNPAPVGRLLKQEDDQRGNVLFAKKSGGHNLKEVDPILIVQADNYQRLFNTRPPMRRMLRRQINGTEYIAINDNDLNSLISNTTNNNHWDEIVFAVPVIVMKGGYAETQFKTLNLGKIRNVTVTANSYTIHFENNTEVPLEKTKQFIRWVGL